MDRFNKHADLYHLLSLRQLAYGQHHSTETAITVVHNDMVRATDAGEVSVLVLLDLSSAFDIVDHDVLLDVLQKRFGVECCALDWFRSYLSKRTQSCASHQDNRFLSVCHALFRRAPDRSTGVCRVHGGYRRNNNGSLDKPATQRRRHAAPKEHAYSGHTHSPRESGVMCCNNQRLVLFKAAEALC